MVTESLRLSIGGLLSVGGITSHCVKHGLLIDTALALQVRRPLQGEGSVKYDRGTATGSVYLVFNLSSLS